MAVSPKLRKEVLSGARKCDLCGDGMWRNSHKHASHTIPKKNGGPDTRANLRPAHADCNELLGAKDARDYRVDRKAGKVVKRGFLEKGFRHLTRPSL